MIGHDSFVHETAILEENVHVGERSKIWHFCQVRKNSIIGNNVSLGKGVFIDQEVCVNDGCRIQNGVSIYKGVTLKKWVFIGPNTTFTNDKFPRAGSNNWKLSKTILNNGASVGAGSIILSDIEIGAFALVGAASIVTSNIMPFHLVYGTPAIPISKICACGKERLDFDTHPREYIRKCCRKNLNKDCYQLAEKEIEKIIHEGS